MNSYFWYNLIGGPALFAAFLLTFQKNRRATFCAAILWVIGTVFSSGMAGYSRLPVNDLSDAKMFWLKSLWKTIFVLSVAESILLLPWISKKIAVYLGKVFLIIITPTVLLFISVLTIYPSFPMVWTFPLGASYVGCTMLWFRIRENFDTEKVAADMANVSVSKFRMPRIAGWTAYCMIVAFLLLLAAPDRISRSMLPFMFPRRATSSGNACINNLRQIEAAANQFALEHHKTNGEAINFPDDLTPYIKLNSAGKIPGCPMGGIYSIKKVGDTPTCTLSTLTPAHALQ